MGVKCGCSVPPWWYPVLHLDSSSGDLLGLNCHRSQRHLLSYDYSTYTLYQDDNHKQDTAHSLASVWKVYVYV